MTKTFALSLVVAATISLAACTKEETPVNNTANVAENAVNAAENTMSAASNNLSNAANNASNAANAM